MTAFLVKETLRKCPSDPVRLRSKSPDATSMSPAASATAASGQFAPISKCVLTLDGYNYVIGKLSPPLIIVAVRHQARGLVSPLWARVKRASKQRKRERERRVSYFPSCALSSGRTSPPLRALEGISRRERGACQKGERKH